jgi:hypothetical protein
VGAVAVVVLTVRVGVGSGVSHALEFLQVQQFVSETAVEALGVVVARSAMVSDTLCRLGPGLVVSTPEITPRAMAQDSIGVAATASIAKPCWSFWLNRLKTVGHGSEDWARAS